MRFGTARYRHGTAIASLAVSLDGKTAVAVSGNHVYGTGRIYDLVTGHVRANVERTASGPASEVAAIAPDGRTVATVGTLDLTVVFNDAVTGKELRTVQLPKSNPWSVTGWLLFSPDGKSMAIASTDGKGIQLLEVDKGALTKTLPHQHAVCAAAFSPDGKVLAGGGYDFEKGGSYFARLWEVATGKELRRFVNGRSGIRALAFSPDGKILAGGDDEAQLRLWDVETGNQLRTWPKDGYRIRSVAFAPDGKTIAAAGDTIRLYDLATGNERLRIDRQAIGLSFSADGKVLTGAVKGAIYKWDAATGRPLSPDAAGDSVVEQIIPSPDGRKLFTRGQDGDAHIWDAQNGAHLQHLRAAWQRGIALSPDGKYLVWAAADDTVHFEDPLAPGSTFTGSRIHLYDTVTNQFIERFPGFNGEAQDLAFLPDGKTLITIDHRNGEVRLWDVPTGKQQRTMRVVHDTERAGSNLVYRAVLSPDGRTLAVTYHPQGRRFSATFSVRLWDVASGKELHELSGHLNYVEALAFSPDSRLLVSGGEPLSEFVQKQASLLPNQVYVWNVANGKRVANLPDGLPTGAASAAFALDGRTMATAAADGTITVWEVATWKARTTFLGHCDRVSSLAFAADGRLFSGGFDTTVLAWDTRPRGETKSK